VVRSKIKLRFVFGLKVKSKLSSVRSGSRTRACLRRHFRSSLGDEEHGERGVTRSGLLNRKVDGSFALRMRFFATRHSSAAEVQARVLLCSYASA
jgi:hypothetical protein